MFQFSISDVASGYKQYFIVLLLLALCYALYIFMSSRLKKNKEQKTRDKRKETLQNTYDQVIKLQDSLIAKFEDILKKAEIYEDFRAINRLNAFISQFNDLIEWFNNSNTDDLYFEEVLSLIQRLFYEFTGLDKELFEIEQELEDLRSLHSGREKEREAHIRKIPLSHSKYFKGCATQKALDQRYRQLVKIYHPDNGGDVRKFAEMQQDYKICKNKVKPSIIPTT